LSLQQVQQQSKGRWHASVVGSYERGDRALAVQKLAGLARFYRVGVSELLPPDDLGADDGVATFLVPHLEGAIGDSTVEQVWMVGVTVRLPADVLRSARTQAQARDCTVTALLREWIEHATARCADHEERVVAVSDLLTLIAASKADTQHR